MKNDNLENTHFLALGFQQTTVGTIIVMKQ